MSADRTRRVRVARIARMLEKHLGTPEQDHHLPPPLSMLVATILSQNTSDRNSHRAYRELRRRFPTWNSVAHASLPALRAAIRIGGMANQKAPRIRAVVRSLHDRHGVYRLGTLRSMSDQEAIDYLTALHGVGIKTAACVLLFSLGRDVFPVDTHVHRVCNRLGLVRDCPTPVKTFEAMRPLLPPGKGYSLHTNMIRFGRRVCRPATPDCGRCPLFDECIYPGKSRRSAALRHPSPVDRDFMHLDNVET